MAGAKKNLGKAPCPRCKDPTAFYQSYTGTLSFKCGHRNCEMSGFAAAHTGAAKAWIEQLAPPAPVPEPVPVKEKPKAFSLGDLK